MGWRPRFAHATTTPSVLPVLLPTEPRRRLRHDPHGPFTSVSAPETVVILLLDNKIDLYSVGRRNNQIESPLLL